MPTVEDGATYRRIVDPPFGLPEGWTAIEKAYRPSSIYAGQAYIRFNGPNARRKHTGSVLSAVKKHAADMGRDVDTELEAYNQALKEREARIKREREEQGKLTSERREEGITKFRSIYGSLTGATFCNFPGWKGES